jgi:hypothetical protein
MEKNQINCESEILIFFHVKVTGDLEGRLTIIVKCLHVNTIIC